MGGSELTLKTKSKEKSSDKQINWKEWLCHSTDKQHVQQQWK
jgi:hypothetical protein